MSDEISFDKSFDLVPGHAKQVAPGVRALVANNPGPFTYKGTVSYIIGSGKVAILDPDPTMMHISARCLTRSAARPSLTFSSPTRTAITRPACQRSRQ